MGRYEQRARTRTAWEAMRDRFRQEWTEAHEVALRHYGGRSALNVIDWFYAHACRQVDERWPDVD